MGSALEEGTIVVQNQKVKFQKSFPYILCWIKLPNQMLCEFWQLMRIIHYSFKLNPRAHPKMSLGLGGLVCLPLVPDLRRRMQFSGSNFRLATTDLIPGCFTTLSSWAWRVVWHPQTYFYYHLLKNLSYTSITWFLRISILIFKKFVFDSWQKIAGSNWCYIIDHSNDYKVTNQFSILI